MRAYLIEFLKALEIAIPPVDGAHHALLYMQYGSTADGWSDRLALQINTKNRILFIDDDDLEKPVASLVAEIAAIAEAIK